MSLNITNREVNGVVVMSLDGRVVFGEEATALRDNVKSLLDAGNKNLVMNVNSVTFIDSAGLGTLVAAHHAAASHGGTLRLCHVGPKFKGMLQMKKLDTVLKVSETEMDAIHSFPQ